MIPVKRIALVSMHTSPVAAPGTADAGGMNVSLLAVAEALVARGCAVDVITRAADAGGTRQLTPGVTLRSLPVGPPGAMVKERLTDYVDEFGAELARIAGFASDAASDDESGQTGTRYDIIHAHYWLSGIAALPAALELSIPFVQTFHTIAMMKDDFRAAGETLEPERRRLSERYLAGQADAVIAVSAAEATYLVERLGAPADRVWVVPPGVDLAVFRPDRAESSPQVYAAMSIDPGVPIVAVVGRIQPLKGHELAIQAVAGLGEPRPVLVIAGEPTPGADDYRSRLRTLSEELGISESVKFVGARDREQVADLLAAAALTLIPSHSETFGLVALESAASGTPVVASFSTGLKESVADGISGVLIDSRDAETWTAEIARLLADDATRRSLGLSARRFAEGYGWGATATSLLSIYASLSRE